MQEGNTELVFDAGAGPDYHFGMSALRQFREAADLTQAELAVKAGTSQPQIKRLEHGERKLTREWADRLAPHLGVSAQSLLFPGSAGEASNAQVGAPILLGATIPLYGQAAGGRDGSFPWNGLHIQDVIAPPSLAGVRGAYAVMVSGDSMAPRYFSGETVYVHPRLPAHKGHFVVAQIAGDEGEPPRAFVKRLASPIGSRTLRLEQFNPRKILEFPLKRVVSVHRIVMGGDG